MTTMDLSAIAIIEKDKTGAVDCAWSYPSIDATTEEILITRSTLQSDGFFFSKHKGVWQYFYTTNAGDSIAGVVQVTISVLSPNFHPGKWSALLMVLSAQYLKTSTPVTLISSFLSVTLGKPVETWSAGSFDEKTALLGGSIGDMFRTFGVHSVLIWTAMLLKKRIVVIGETSELVLGTVRVFPQLVWGRQNWSILRPIMNLSPIELSDLGASGVYCAGFLESSGVKSRDDLYDLLVDVSAREVTIAEHAKEDFRMGELHKEVASFMLQSTAEGSSVADSDLIKGVFARTSKITNAAKSLCAKDPSLSPQTLDDAKVPKSTHRFMYNVALAEGLLA
jgi:hypothetical protein